MVNVSSTDSIDKRWQLEIKGLCKNQKNIGQRPVGINVLIAQWLKDSRNDWGWCIEKGVVDICGYHTWMVWHTGVKGA